MQVPEKEYNHIQAWLDDIERTEKVAILFAIESGSRAWGFASPDSDYDVRFIYAHPQDWYLSVLPQRDVIERDVDEYLADIAGWDLRKALRLLLKSNPALYEWLVSPITYRENAKVRHGLRDMFERYASRTMLMHHYHSLARTQWNRYMEGKTNVRLKKYFYVIRPLLSLLWLQKNQILPPMNIQALLQGVSLKKEVSTAIQKLLDLKQHTSELGEGRRIKTIDNWVDSVVNGIAIKEDQTDMQQRNAASGAADRFFRQLLSKE